MLKDTLFELLGIDGPSGREEKIADRIRELAQDACIRVRTDAMGNLIMEKPGQEDGRVIMLSAHMDQVGFVVVDAEKDGFLRVAPVGEIGKDPFTPRAVIFSNGVTGTISAEPNKSGEPQMTDLFVDIGAENRRQALEWVSLGDMCVYAPQIYEPGEHRVAAPAMDDRCGCALLAELLLSCDQPRNTLVAVFSVQEELGMRGAASAAYQVQPDLGIALDVTAWGDTPGTKIPAIRLGKGPAIKFMDDAMVSTPRVRDQLIRLAQQEGIPVQREVLPFGGTDGASIQHSRAGVPACTLSIPCRYVHSACETIDMRDLENALRLLQAAADAEWE